MGADIRRVGTFMASSLSHLSSQNVNRKGAYLQGPGGRCEPLTINSSTPRISILPPPPSGDGPL